MPKLPVAQQKPAFLVPDLIETLTSIISAHIRDEKHNIRQRSRFIKTDAEQKQGMKNYSDSEISDVDSDDESVSNRPNKSKANKKKNSKKSGKGNNDGSDDEDDDQNGLDSNGLTSFHKKQLPLFIPYSTLHQCFNIATGHGWTPYHIETYGPLKVFLVQHNDTFAFHSSSERVGLLSALPPNAKLLYPELNNDIWLGTSVHLYSGQYYQEENDDEQSGQSGQNGDRNVIQWERQQLKLKLFHEYLDQVTYVGHRQLDSSRALITHGPKGGSLLGPKANLSHTASPPPLPTTTHASIPTIDPTLIGNLDAGSLSLSATQAQKEQRGGKEGAIKGKKGVSSLNASNYDQHDLEEKLKNRGCAPEAKSTMRLPLMVLLMTVLLYVLVSALIESGVLHPEAIAQQNTVLHRLLVANRGFVGDILRDVGLK